MAEEPDDGRTPLLVGGLAAVAARYDLVLCDVWGVIHNGVAAYPAAVEALRRFRAQGGRVVLVTNAPVPAGKVVARLDRLAVPPDAYDAIATSGDVTMAMIVEAGCPAILSIGPDREIDLYREAARVGARKPALVGVEAAGLAVAVGLSPTVGLRPEDYDDLLRRMRARDLTMICANPDLVVEVGETLEYCAGAIAARYEAIGGRVIQAGKPFAPIYERALSLADARELAPGRVLAIGDTVHTDLVGARDRGFDSLFVTAGVHRAELHGSARGAPLDRAALDQLVAARGIAPTAATPALGWS